ncbi:hypothetical protein GCM10010359_10500 [Streptomyces morookaense]|nr:hypothetical protein GCM10010359_10500 [Streptomyces morookaense]
MTSSPAPITESGSAQRVAYSTRLSTPVPARTVATVPTRRLTRADRPSIRRRRATGKAGLPGLFVILPPHTSDLTFTPV